MKELICFTVGLIVGAIVVKKNQEINELEKELDYKNRSQRA